MSLATEGSGPVRPARDLYLLRAEGRIDTASRNGELPAREVLELLPAAVYTIDRAGRITFFNEAAAECAFRADAGGHGRGGPGKGLTRPGLINGGEKPGQDATLHALVQTIFAPCVDPERTKDHGFYIITGPCLPISGNAVTSIALVLHARDERGQVWGSIVSWRLHPHRLVREEGRTSADLERAWRPILRRAGGT